MTELNKEIALLPSLKWSLQWAVAVVLRHPQMVAAYAAAGAVVGLLSTPMPGLGAVLLLAYSVALVPLALVAHREVLVGPTRLDAATLGEGYSRVIGYCLDLLVLFLLAALYCLLPILVIGFLAAPGSTVTVEGVLEVVLSLVIVFAVAAAFARPALRLPSRVLDGAPIGWREAWHLGRSNGWTLTFAQVVIALLFAFVDVLAGMLLPELVSGAIMVLILPLQVVLTCTFLSVAFGQLQDMMPLAHH